MQKIIGSQSIHGHQQWGRSKRPLAIAKAVAPAYGYFKPAALRSSAALSVFSHENAVAVCFLPEPSV